MFLFTGVSRFREPQNYPWTIGGDLSFVSETRGFAKFILKEKPDAKIAVLYQNDDYGKDHLNTSSLSRSSSSRLVSSGDSGPLLFEPGAGSCGVPSYRAVLTVLNHPRRQKAADDPQQALVADAPRQAAHHHIVVDPVEEALDVEIEHPVVTPAALASLVHGIDRRFAGPVAIGVGVERRLKDRL